MIIKCKCGIVPGEKETREKIDLSKRKRTDLLTRALEDGYIQKNGKTRFKIDLNFAGWDRFKNKN